MNNGTHIISKNKHGTRAEVVRITTDPITGKKTSKTQHLVLDRQTQSFVVYSKTINPTSGHPDNIQEVIL